MITLDSNQIKELVDKITEIADAASTAKYHLLLRNDLNESLNTLDTIKDIIENIHNLVNSDLI